MQEKKGILRGTPGFWRDNWFLLVFLGWFAFKQLSMSNILIFGRSLEVLDWRVDCVTMALLMVQILFFQHYSRRELIVTAALTAVFAFAAFHSQEWMILVLWLFLVAAKDQDLNRVLKLTFFLLLGTVLLIVLLAVTGMIQLDSTGGYRNGARRLPLGYNHPNVLGMCVQLLVTLAVYLRRKKLGVLELLLCAGAAVFINFVPQSRASAACVVMLIPLILYCKLAPLLPMWLRRTVMICLLVIPLVLGLVSVYYSIFYTPDNSVLLYVDTLLSGRFRCGYKLYLLHPITLFGPSKISLVNCTDDPLDNGYFFLLLQYGIVPSLCYFALHLMGSLRVVRSGNELLAGIIAIYSIHAVAERSQVELWFNVFTLFFLIAVYQNTPAEEALRQDGAPIWDK